MAHIYKVETDAGIEVQGASAGIAAPSAIIDPIGEGGGAAEVAALTEHEAQEDAVPAVGGGVLTAAGWGAPAETMNGARNVTPIRGTAHANFTKT